MIVYCEIKMWHYHFKLYFPSCGGKGLPYIWGIFLKLSKQKCAQILPLEIQQLVIGAVLTNDTFAPSLNLRVRIRYLRVVMRTLKVLNVLYTILNLLGFYWTNTNIGVKKVWRCAFVSTSPMISCLDPNWEKHLKRYRLKQRSINLIDA